MYNSFSKWDPAKPVEFAFSNIFMWLDIFIQQTNIVIILVLAP